MQDSPTTFTPTKTNTVATLTGTVSVLPTVYREMSDPHEINATCKAQLLKEFPWVTSVTVDNRRRHTMRGRHTSQSDCSGWIYRVEGTRRDEGVVTRTAAVMFFKMDAECH